MNPIPDIRDIKGLVPLPGWPWWVWALVALTILVVAVLLVRWWRRRQPREVLPPVLPVISPFDRARRALDQLRADRLIDLGETDLFYTRLSGIVRRYLEDQFGLRAPERTTEEFLEDVARGGGLSQRHRELLQGFLQECDLVKFARHQPGRSDMERAFEAAETFVRESRTEVVGVGGAA